MLLDKSRSQLLVVDVQERLLPAMHEGQAMVARCAILMQAAQRLEVPVTISEQYRKGLGATVAPLEAVKGDAQVFEKMHFSCAADAAINTRVRGLASEGRSQLIVCGIESHVCVLQSALGFNDMGLRTVVVGDAVTSRKPESVTLTYGRFRDNHITVANTEMVVFEWLHVAGTPAFKELSALIK